VSHPAQTKALQRVYRLFDSPLIQNNLRGLYVEQLVAELLGNDWKAVSADWRAWDIEHRDGTKLEVKQSAAVQTWHRPHSRRSSPRFGIRIAKNPWDGEQYIDGGGRQASIYVFAWHPVETEASDQRDPTQWQFFVAEARNLPAQDTIGLTEIRKISEPALADDLAEVVANMKEKGRLQ